MSKGNKVLQAVVSQIIERCEEKGITPWQAPYSLRQSPMNLEYKNAYTGINRWATSLSGFNSPYWVSFSQVQKLGGKIKKGQKHTKIVKMALIEKTKENAKGEQEVYARWVQPVRYYKMWNVEQTEGIEVEDFVQTEFEPIESCEHVLVNCHDKPTILYDGSEPQYDQDTDQIRMPKQASFKTKEDFYNALFHELAHSTGHEKRLNRRTLVQVGEYGTKTYSKEELVAELTSAMLSSHCGILEKTINSSTSYVKGWLDTLKANPRMLLSSAGLAEKAFKYIVRD